jgi:hypothetical protein
VPEPSDDALQRYAASMEKIKVRTASALGLLKGSLGIPAVEAASLQTRLALEELMLSTLTTHEDSIQAVMSAFHKADHAAVRKVLQRINPGYWPTPTMQVEVEPGQWRWDDVQDEYLLEEDYGPRWGRLGAWCHARNPWSPELQVEAGVELIRSTIGLLIGLLNHHHVTLADSDHLVNCMMQASHDGRVHVALFGRA